MRPSFLSAKQNMFCFSGMKSCLIGLILSTLWMRGFRTKHWILPSMPPLKILQDLITVLAEIWLWLYGRR